VLVAQMSARLLIPPPRIDFDDRVVCTTWIASAALDQEVAVKVVMLGEGSTTTFTTSSSTDGPTEGPLFW
jgi:hypothetical protein